jgi:hypothetical protein
MHDTASTIHEFTQSILGRLGVVTIVNTTQENDPATPAISYGLARDRYGTPGYVDMVQVSQGLSCISSNVVLDC